MTLLLIIILGFAAMPVFLWKETRLQGISILFLYAGYCFLVRDWLFGELTMCHDSYQGYQFFFNITRQWIQTDTGFGWNPYLGAGQPMAVMSNLFFSVPTILLAYAELYLDLALSPLKFANVVYISIMFFSATGMVLLLQLLFRNAWVTLFGVTAYVWGGMFIYNLHQMWPILFAYPLTYSFFFLIHSCKTGTWSGIALFSIYAGDIANHYIPLYVYLTMAFIVLGLFLFSPEWIKQGWKKLNLKKNGLKAIVCLALYFLTASPAIHSYLELKDYVSPSRGFSERGTVSSKNTGEQEPVSVKFSSYMNLFHKEWINWEPRPWHTSAYMGAVPAVLIFSFLPMALWRNRMLCSIGIAIGALVILSLGHVTPLWSFIVDSIPLFNLLRHPALFSTPVTVLSILLAAGCLNYVLSQKKPGLREAIGLFAGLGIFITLNNFNYFGFQFESKAFKESMMVWVLLFSMVAIFLIRKRRKNPQFKLNNIPRIYFSAGLVLMLLIHLVELGIYTRESIRPSPDYTLKEGLRINPWDLKDNILVHGFKGLCLIPDYEMLPMRYPVRWASRCDTCKEDYQPYQITPMVFKSNVWSHPEVNYMLMLQKEFAKTFQTDIAPLSSSGRNMIVEGDLFYLISKADGWGTHIKDLKNSDLLNENYVTEFKLPEDWNSGEVYPEPSNNPNRIALRVHAKRDAYLLRMENFDAGWSATVDKKPVPIKSTEMNFQIVPIPEGEHWVELRYESWLDFWIRVSFFISIAGWVAHWVWLGRMRERPTLPQPIDEMPDQEL